MFTSLTLRCLLGYWEPVPINEIEIRSETGASMANERDPEATLEQWKDEMRAEHKDAIENPDPDEDHGIEAVMQVNYRLYYEYDTESASLERAREKQVDELTDPELLACSCGVRGMTRPEARAHIEAVRSG